jgi:hypothetical protein
MHFDEEEFKRLMLKASKASFNIEDKYRLTELHKAKIEEMTFGDKNYAILSDYIARRKYMLCRHCKHRTYDYKLLNRRKCQHCGAEHLKD